jgi:hypothetical protein
VANEIQRVYGTTVTLEASGASISNNAIAQADDANIDLSDDTPADYFDGDFALTCAFGGTPTAGTSVSLILRPLDIDGTTDAPAPTATYLHHFYGSFLHNGGSSSQTLLCMAERVPRRFSAYLYNNATGQTLSSGWVLKFTPVSYRPA